MYFHATNIKDLRTLKPHVSSHGKAWVYFSTKKENVLVYLSNPVEKYIKEKHNRALSEYVKWASYGFSKEGLIRIEEYYPNATEETFKGVSGYIYQVKDLKEPQPLKGIKDVYITQEEVKVEACELIIDAYEAILKAEKEGKIEIQRFENQSDKKRETIKNMIINEYQNTEKADYKEFLLDKFDWLKQTIQQDKQK